MDVFRYDTKTISILIFIFLNLVAFKLLPTNGKLQEMLALGMFFVVIPFVYSRFILKNSFQFFGLKMGDWRKGVILSGISLGVSLLILYTLFSYFGFADNYRLPQKVSSDFVYFVYYELVVVLFLNLAYEFFFRGFLMFHLEKILGYWSVLFQWAVFLVLVFFNARFSWSLVPYMIFFPFAGWIALKSRSLYYPLVAQTIFIIITDIVFIKTAF